MNRPDGMAIHEQYSLFRTETTLPGIAPPVPLHRNPVPLACDSSADPDLIPIVADRLPIILVGILIVSHQSADQPAKNQARGTQERRTR
jgi:hypothetical protein